MLRTRLPIWYGSLPSMTLDRSLRASPVGCHLTDTLSSHALIRFTRLMVFALNRPAQKYIPPQPQIRLDSIRKQGEGGWSTEEPRGKSTRADDPKNLFSPIRIASPNHKHAVRTKTKPPMHAKRPPNEVQTIPNELACASWPQ